MNRSCLFNEILPFRSIDNVIIGEILSDEPDDEFVGKLVDAKKHACASLWPCQCPKLRAPPQILG